MPTGCGRGPALAAEAVAIAAVLEDAFASLRRAGYLHGNVKPSNIGFTSEGSPKLFDFGLAREANDTATLGGTLRYMSPEALVGRPAEEADDVWSLCVVLNEMVSGRHPFADGGSAADVRDRIGRQRRSEDDSLTARSGLSSAVLALTPWLLTAPSSARSAPRARSPTRLNPWSRRNGRPLSPLFLSSPCFVPGLQASVPR